MRQRWLLAWLLCGCGGGDDYLAVRLARDAGGAMETAGSAQPDGRIDVTDFGDLAGLRRNGAAVIVGGALRLTDVTGDLAGSAFFEAPFTLTPTTRFSIALSYRVVRGTGDAADGLAIVLQASGKGSAALGGAGAGLGYAPIAPSVAVELDEHQNMPTEPYPNRVAVARDGVVEPPVVEAPVGFSIAGSPEVFVWIDYDAGQLAVRAARDATRPDAYLVQQSAPLEKWLGNRAYLGFTASTGVRTALHEVLTLSVTWRDAGP